MSVNGFTQSAVASQLGISQSTVSRYVRKIGKRTGPARKRAAEALGRIQNIESGYSSLSVPHDLAEKLAKMCEHDGDAAMLKVLLDAVAAYRQGARE